MSVRLGFGVGVGRRRGVAYSPASETGLKLWIDGSTGLTGGVPTDLGPGGVVLSQATAGKRPTIGVADAGFNSRDVFVFDGVDDYLDVALDLTGLASFTAIAALKVAGGFAGIGGIFQDTTPFSNTLLVWNVPPVVVGQSTNGSDLRGVAMDPTARASVYSSTHVAASAAAYALRVDGTDQTVLDYGGAMTNTALGNGCRIGDFFGGGFCLPMKLGALLVFAPAISGAALARVEAYLKARFATP